MAAQHPLNPSVKQIEFGSRPVAKSGASVVPPLPVLLPDTLHKTFPESDAHGQFANYLPFLVLNNAHAPFVFQNKRRKQWLGLLLFDESEVKSGKVSEFTVTANQLPKDQNWFEQEAYFLHNFDQLKVDLELLDQILPDLETLSKLSHTVIPEIDDDEPNPMRVALLGSRLPKPQSKSYVYLVALAGPLNEMGLPESQIDAVQFLILHKWSFTDTSPAKPLSPKQILDCGAYFKAAVKDIGPFRYAVPSDSESEFIASGKVPAPDFVHAKPNEKAGYAGPLGTRIVGKGLPLPALHAEDLIGPAGANGIVDYSYAAAWRLGQQMSSHNRKIAAAISSWKTARSEFKQSKKAGDYPQPSPLLKQWLTQLTQLEGVPYHYLITGSSLLPLNSFRYFRLDKHWVQALLDGALSLGRETEADVKADQSPPISAGFIPAHTTISGFLLHADPLSYWPKLQVKGTDAKRKPLPLLHTFYPDVKIVGALFNGELAGVHVGAPTPVIRYGFQQRGDQLDLPLRKLRETLFKRYEGTIVIHHRNEPTLRLPDFSQIAQELNHAFKQAIVPGSMGIELARLPDDGVGFTFPPGNKPSIDLVKHKAPKLSFKGTATFRPEHLWLPDVPLSPPQPNPDPGIKTSKTTADTFAKIDKDVDIIEEIMEASSKTEAPATSPPLEQEAPLQNQDPPQHDSPQADPPSELKSPVKNKDAPPVSDHLQELSDALNKDPKHFFRVAVLGAIVALILIAVGIFVVNKIGASSKQHPLITSFEGMRNIEALKLVEQYYSEIVPITDNDGQLQFLMEVPAHVAGYMDMSKMEYELDEQKKVVSVRLPEVQIGDPEFEMDSVKEQMYRGSKISLFLGGGGKSYAKAYKGFAASLTRTKDAIRKSAIKNYIVEDTESKGRLYVMHTANSLGYSVKFKKEKSSKNLEERIKEEVKKWVDKSDSTQQKDKRKRQRGGES